MAAPDPLYGHRTADITASASVLFAITPGTGNLTYRTRALWVGTGGDVVVVDASGNEVLISNVPDGTMLPIRVDKVLATESASPGVDTTASDLVGFY